MKSFSNYLNKIKAEEELKEQTKIYIQEALAQKDLTNIDLPVKSSFKNRKSLPQKILVPLVSVAACAMLAIGGFTYYNTPVNYLSLDINPSIELGINAFGKVVTAESYNDDGAGLLTENKINGLSVEQAINNLVQKAAEQGFISEDGSTVIAVTAESNQEDDAINLQNTSKDGIAAALTTKNIPAIVYTDCSNLELRTQAKNSGISPGKYKLILILQALDPTITIDQYQNTKVTDIITKIDELLATADPEQSQEYSAMLGMIRNTAQEVQLAKGMGAMEQNRNGVQNQNPDANQEQQQTQNRYQDQSCIDPEQESNQNQGTTTPEQEQNRNQGAADPTVDTNSNSAQGGGITGTGNSDTGKKSP